MNLIRSADKVYYDKYLNGEYKTNITMFDDDIYDFNWLETIIDEEAETKPS